MEDVDSTAKRKRKKSLYLEGEKMTDLEVIFVLTIATALMMIWSWEDFK